jgi:hypothetical protein
LFPELPLPELFFTPPKPPPAVFPELFKAIDELKLVNNNIVANSTDVSFFIDFSPI